MDTLLTPAEVIEADEVLLDALGIPSDSDFKFGFKVQIFNQRMRKLRIGLGLTQKELSKRSGLKTQRAAVIEGFRAFPNPEEAKRIAQVLRTTVAYLFPEWLRFYVVEKSSREFVSSVSEINSALERAPSEALKLFFAEPTAREDQPESQVMLADLGKAVRQAVKELTPREQKVIEMRFGLDGEGRRTQEQIGKILGLTSTRVMQLEHKALKNLRQVRISMTLRHHLR